MNVKLLTTLIFALLLPGLATANQASEYKLKQLTEAVEQVSQRLTSQRQALSREEQRLAELDQSISANRVAQQQLTRQIGELESSLLDLEAEQQALEVALAEQRDKVAKILVTVYQSSRQPMLKMLLSQDGPATVARTIAYFDYVNEAQREVLLSFQADLEALADTEQQIRQSRQALATDKTQLDQAQADLVQQQQRRRQVLNRLRASVSGTQEELENKQASQARMSELVAEMRQAIVNIEVESTPAGPGQMGWPASGRVVQAYNAPLGDNRVRSQGIVISAPSGSAVTAVHHGRVIFADWLRGFGMLVIVEHGEGLLTLYGRNDALMVNVGEWVEVGQQIGQVGSSGGFDQPGLYFEVRQSGQPVNPVSWLAQR